MNGEVNKFKVKVKAQAPETYYEITQGRYFIEDANGNWLPVNETQFKRVLKHRGLSNSVEQGEFVSPIDKAILNVQQTRNIHFAGPLAGYPKGYYDFDQHRVLVTESPRLIKPEEGFWNTLMKVIGGLLDDGVQLPYFYGWLKVAVTSLRTGNWLPGQVMVFCGPHGGGKSLLQQLVTLILGGRVARPYQFMMGSTSFNADIFGAEHLAIEDEAPSTDMRSRRSFGSQIKGITVCSAQRMHAKHCTPIILQPFWRISLSINDEPENVQVLPPIDDSLTDKIILLKARRVEMPMPTSTPSQRKLFWDTLVSELPAFLAFLDRWEIPADLVSQRFGVKEYHNPAILADRRPHKISIAYTSQTSPLPRCSSHCGRYDASLMAIKKSDLYSSLWASCDELRGGMDASQYKDYVLFMLFIKYVSDKYGDYDGFEPPIVIPSGASFKDMAALKGKANIGELVNTQVIQPLVDANTRLARTDFPDFDDPNKLGDGSSKVERIGNLIAIFENPALDFSGNRAENDDILGDAYEYLMRHFASESGKSKGQFYTPSEVSRIMAKVIGISPTNTKASTTAYDPTCGSGSLLLKVAAEAGKHITLEGQEKDGTTAGLARMNMILHDFPTANIQSGGEGTLVKPKFLDGEQLRTYDYVVANPPFSDKTWSTGLTLGEGGSGDTYLRFTWGVPPKKQGDYAYLLHIVRSIKSTGKGACILPHGVLFRGNAEAVIRQQLVRSGYLKAIIGLPANLFYGTGIPACIVVLDKENAAARKGIFMMDASKGFKKDGPKNRLREQDLHKIVDTFARQDESDPRYARMVPVAEIADPKNDYNLNLPRYIDSTEPEDLQDIDGHLRGGIPQWDLDGDPSKKVKGLAEYWKIMPTLRETLFQPFTRPGYCQLRMPIAEVKPAIFGHPEFTAFTTKAKKLFTKWQTATVPQLKGFAKDGHPKPLIEAIAEDLLATFKTAPLLDAYDVYQHLMDYWAATMQDDCYLIAAVGWREGAQPREICQVKNKENKLVWPEEHDFKKGKRRFKSDLVPAPLLIARYFTAERDAIATLEVELAGLEQQLDEKREEQSSEEGLLAEVIEGEGEKQKITAKAVKARLKEIGRDPDYADERAALEEYAALMDQHADTKAKLKAAQDDLETKIGAKYPTLTEDDIKTLVVDDKWLAILATAVQGELDRVSQTLTGRIRQLAERYADPLPAIVAQVHALAAKVDTHLVKMGAKFN